MESKHMGTIFRVKSRTSPYYRIGVVSYASRCAKAFNGGMVKIKFGTASRTGKSRRLTDYDDWNKETKVIKCCFGCFNERKNTYKTKQINRSTYMNNTIIYKGVLAAMFIMPVSSGLASINVQDLGTIAPPATLGGYKMTAFPFDNRVGQFVYFVNGLSFNSPVMVAQATVNGWNTWSHGYSGNVYYADFDRFLYIALPAQTRAFYFYAEPNLLGSCDITAISNDGASLTINVNGNSGANGFGFFTSGETLTSIYVSSAEVFAVGEFGIAAVPEPSTYLVGLSALGMLGLFGWRNRK